MDNIKIREKVVDSFRGKFYSMSYVLNEVKKEAPELPMAEKRKIATQAFSELEIIKRSDAMAPITAPKINEADDDAEETGDDELEDLGDDAEETGDDELENDVEEDNDLEAEGEPSEEENKKFVMSPSEYFNKIDSGEIEISDDIVKDLNDFVETPDETGAEEVDDLDTTDDLGAGAPVSTEAGTDEMNLGAELDIDSEEGEEDSEDDTELEGEEGDEESDSLDTEEDDF